LELAGGHFKRLFQQIFYTFGGINIDLTRIKEVLSKRLITLEIRQVLSFWRVSTNGFSFGGQK
jgi:hypothetical protein